MHVAAGIPFEFLGVLIGRKFGEARISEECAKFCEALGCDRDSDGRAIGNQVCDLGIRAPTCCGAFGIGTAALEEFTRGGFARCTVRGVEERDESGIRRGFQIQS